MSGVSDIDAMKGSSLNMRYHVMRTFYVVDSATMAVAVRDAEPQDEHSKVVVYDTLTHSLVERP